MNSFYAKDFIETTEGLRFAVVKNGTEQGKVLCFLRYFCLTQHWQKIDTQQANLLLEQHYPQYLHFSNQLDAFLHAVEVEQITQHYQPKLRLQTLLNLPSFENLAGLDNTTQDLLRLCQLFQQAGLDLTQVGVTGSLLVGTQTESSDIDLVFYQRDTFQQARRITALLIAQNNCQPLAAHDWQQSFQRRNCSLNFADYLWHEQRKLNKALINGRKFDLSLVTEESELAQSYQKLGFITLTVQINSDEYAFDYPAKFLVHHPQISSIVCFTATYYGQAQNGEWVEVAGQLELADTGEKRIVVGSSREADGEYIKVLR